MRESLESLWEHCNLPCVGVYYVCVWVEVKTEYSPSVSREVYGCPNTFFLWVIGEDRTGIARPARDESKRLSTVTILTQSQFVTFDIKLRLGETICSVLG